MLEALYITIKIVSAASQVYFKLFRFSERGGLMHKLGAEFPCCLRKGTNPLWRQWLLSHTRVALQIRGITGDIRRSRGFSEAIALFGSIPSIEGLGSRG